MRREYIKNFNNIILGSLDYEDNGDIVARDFNQRILGFYRAKEDVTTDFMFRIISHGNTVVQFIYKEN